MKAKRTTWVIVGLLATGSQSVLLAGCSSGPSYPAGPIINVIPTSWDYTTNPQTYAVYVGEQPNFSAQIQNPSTTQLVIKSVTLTPTGGAFTLDQPSPAGIVNNDAGVLKLSIGQPPDSAAISVIFAPTDTVIYNATITITSNAINDGGTAIINIHALGVQADGGIPADAGVLEDAGLYDDGG
jgi:hypothetical protein